MIEAWRPGLRRGVRWILALTGAGTAGLILFGGGLGPVGRALLDSSRDAAVWAVFAVALEWAADAGRYAAAARGTGVRASPLFWLKLALVNLFGAYVANLGAPITAYLLTRRKMAWSRALALTVAKQSLFVPAAVIPTLATGFFESNERLNPWIRGTLGISFLFSLVVFGSLVGLALWPQATGGWLERRAPPALSVHIRGFVEGITAFYRDRPLWLLVSLALAFVNQGALAAASVALLRGLGARGGTLWVRSYVFSTLSQVAPTPGGAGVSEVSGVWLLQGLLPPATAAAHLILWRFLAMQLPMAVGGLLLLSEVRGPFSTNSQRS